MTVSGDTKKLMGMVDPSSGFPVITAMLLSVCGGDHGKFEEGCRLLLLAYEAGRASALQDAPAPAPPRG